MVLRLRLRPGRPISRKKGKNRHVALALAALLWPAILIAYVLGFWRLANDLGIAGGFGISDGVFSHWQAWIGMAAGLNVAALILNRYGHAGEMRLPHSWFAWMTNFGRRT